MTTTPGVRFLTHVEASTMSENGHTILTDNDLSTALAAALATKADKAELPKKISELSDDVGISPVKLVAGKAGVVTLTAADVNAVPSSALGVANGVATLGVDGKIPVSQIPSSATPESHNQLQNIQGGMTNEFYHLTSSEYVGTGNGVILRQNNPKINGFSVSNTGKIYVDNGTTKTFGWNDNVQMFTVKTAGTTDPQISLLFGNMYGYTWSPSARNEVWVDFHILHDYAVGTPVYPHIHWMPTTNNSGTVRWGIEYTVAQGHGIDTFPTTTSTVYIEQTISNANRYKHMIAEVSDANAIPATDLNIDGFIKMRVFRDATHANDTYPDTVHAWCVDLHYQTSQLSTKNKAPGFFD